MISPVINTDHEIDKEISQLLSRVECYESSIEQLHKEIPKYLENHSNTSKETLAFSKVLRYLFPRLFLITSSNLYIGMSRV